MRVLVDRSSMSRLRSGVWLLTLCLLVLYILGVDGGLFDVRKLWRLMYRQLSIFVEIKVNKGCPTILAGWLPNM